MYLHFGASFHASQCIFIYLLKGGLVNGDEHHTKIIRSHLVNGKMIPGNEISIKIDQTLTQDTTGTMAYLAFETLGLKKLKLSFQ